jgi:hypothetical protein
MLTLHKETPPTMVHSPHSYLGELVSSANSSARMARLNTGTWLPMSATGNGHIFQKERVHEAQQQRKQA